ncbi:hypothetical protein [Cryptosporangium aurantiacum]|uniref:Uncharacterized protein n=1 Tax=Cryptosporangium aurantiacum TaxID=134849 RepID=A0A1M7QRV9_9ACTN|nr:hypothetical protein [Cryptosporangium aurantiacum]SHN34045.1 hypothetical protein SAMN05443668_105213 [Cryptosporangium aurantiacum]
MKRFASPYGAGCCLLCIRLAVVIVGDSTGEAAVCERHQRDLFQRSAGRIHAIATLHAEHEEVPE